MCTHLDVGPIGFEGLFFLQEDLSCILVFLLNYLELFIIFLLHTLNVQNCYSILLIFSPVLTTSRMLFLYILSLLVVLVCFVLLECSLGLSNVSGGGCVMIILLLFIEIRSPSVVQAGLKPKSFLSQSSKCWNYKHFPPCQINIESSWFCQIVLGLC